MAYSISKVAICNIALVSLGADTINSLTEQTSTAIACNAMFDTVRRDLLRKHPWNFAMKQQELARSVTTPVFGYAYQYQLPSDCLRVWRVLDNDDFKVQGSYIHTDAETCFVEYVYDVEDVSRWDASFIDLMAAAMAASIAFPVTESAAKEDRARAVFKDKFTTAKAVDASEDIQPEMGMYADTLINVRY